MLMERLQASREPKRWTLPGSLSAWLQKSPDRNGQGFSQVAYDSVFRTKFHSENKHLGKSLACVLFVGFALPRGDAGGTFGPVIPMRQDR
ncbi:hypothetical protein [Pseudomonas sp. UBA6562]|uniref:hypothetical protein n=1 Tax=Pseudomonas sp. UBA6562 TaxID=1947332 RepID=UPI0025E6CA77|nr:hypothetical protein [Pseudomonas sp. UBA6562]